MPETMTAEETMDSQLEALKESIKPSAAATPPAVPAPAPVTAPTETTEPAVPPAAPVTPAVDPLDAKLATITDETVAEPKAPSLTDDQQQVLSIVPNVRALSQLNQQAQSYQQLDNVLANRDFAALEQMMAPEVLSDFKEYLYKKHVASEEWIARWVKDKEGNPAINTELTQQQRQIQALQARLDAQESQKHQQSQQATRQQIETAYRGHIKGLFDRIEFSEADRRWVAADIDQRVGRDPRLLAEINNKNMAAINAVFKTAVKEYVQRDQSTQVAKDAALAAQGQHKPLVQGQQIVETGLLPDDIKQVPAGQEENWMDQQLARLKSKMRR